MKEKEEKNFYQSDATSSTVHSKNALSNLHICLYRDYFLRKHASGRNNTVIYLSDPT